MKLSRSHMGWLFAMFVMCVGQQASAQNWQVTGAPSVPWFYLACSADGTKLVAASDQVRAIFISTNSGALWQQTSAPNLQWLGVASSADGMRLSAFAPGAVWLSTNGGADWFQSSLPSYGWHALAVSTNSQRMIAAGGQGPIYTSTDFGQTWVSNNMPNDRFWYCAAASADGTKMAVAGISLGIWTNSGVNWGKTTASNTVAWFTMVMSGDGKKMFAASGGSAGIYGSTNSGQDWFKTSAPGYNWISLVASSDAQKLLAVSANGRLYTSTDHGSTWVSNNIASPWACAASSADGSRLYAASSSSSASGSIYSWQYAPKLSITKSNAAALVSWPDSVYTNIFILQTNQSFTAWGDSSAIISDDGTNRSATVPTAGNLYFRLRQ